MKVVQDRQRHDERRCLNGGTLIIVRHVGRCGGRIIIIIITIIIVITIITIITMFQRELLDLLHGGPPVPQRAQADAEDQILPADK